MIYGEILKQMGIWETKCIMSMFKTLSLQNQKRQLIFHLLQ